MNTMVSIRDAAKGGYIIANSSYLDIAAFTTLQEALDFVHSIFIRKDDP